MPTGELIVASLALVATIVLGTIPVREWIRHWAPWLWPRPAPQDTPDPEPGLDGRTLPLEEYATLKALVDLKAEVDDLKDKLRTVETKVFGHELRNRPTAKGRDGRRSRK